MPVRSQGIDTEAAAFERINNRLRTIEDSLRDRLLPPGYTVNVVAGNIEIQRGDGATSTLVFA
jgi:hypothetical protein